MLCAHGTNRWLPHLDIHICCGQDIRNKCSSFQISEAIFILLLNILLRTIVFSEGTGNLGRCFPNP
jgi:hypothetical protein